MPVLYPVGRGIFIHVDPSTGTYNVVEPSKPSEELVNKVETLIALTVAEEGFRVSDEDRAEVLMRVFPKAVKRGKLRRS